ncbi:MAG: tyrosine recombinase XerC, partial [Clostridia bacterium]
PAPPYLNDFLNYMETVKGKSSHTVKEYFYDLRTFLRFLKSIKISKSQKVNEDASIEDITMDTLREVTLSDLYSYMSWLTREKGNAPPSRARKVASIRSFFKYLTDKANLMDYNPAHELESPKLQKKLPKYLNIEESGRLLNAIDGDYAERNYAIIILFLNCGMRLSELVGININRIRKDTLTVLGKGNKERTIYLNHSCIEAIENYLKVRPHDGVKDKQALFLSKRKTRISREMVQSIVKKFITASGLDPERYSTHKLRHTAATLMYQHGKVDIRSLQEILGHESISTTEIYTHVDSTQLKEAVASNPLADFKKDS